MQIENARRARAERGLRSDLINASYRFAEADRDGNQELDFGDFQELLPQRVREEALLADIRTVFGRADLDQDGVISLYECETVY